MLPPRVNVRTGGASSITLIFWQRGVRVAPAGKVDAVTQTLYVVKAGTSIEAMPRLSVVAQPTPSIHTSTPLAGVSLGQAILTCTRQAFVVRPEKTNASKPDIIIFFIGLLFCFMVAKPPDP